MKIINLYIVLLYFLKKKFINKLFLIIFYLKLELFCKSFLDKLKFLM